MSSSGILECAEIHKRVSSISMCKLNANLVSVPDCLNGLSFGKCPLWDECAPDRNASFTLGDGGTVEVYRCTASPTRVRTLAAGSGLLLIAVIGLAWLWLRHQHALSVRTEMLVSKIAASDGLTRVGGAWVPAR